MEKNITYLEKKPFARHTAWEKRSTLYCLAKLLFMKMKHRIIKDLLKEIVYEKSKSEFNECLSFADINWENFKFILDYHEVSSFLYILLKANYSLFPEKIFNFLKNSYHSELVNYISLLTELLKIIHISQKQNLLVIPIKGFSFTETYYKKFGFRPLLDIDLLTKEENFERVVLLLESLGYKKHLSGGTENYWRTHQCHLEFLKESTETKILVELHWSLDFRRYNKKLMPMLWHRLKKINIKGHEIFTLSPEDSILSLALHQRRFGKVLNLKYVIDIGLILEKEEIDWSYLLKTAEQESIRASLYFLLYQVQFVLDKNLNEFLTKLNLPFWQKKLIFQMIKKYIYSPPSTPQSLSYVYTICHFLFYDNITYPLKFIFHIPQEQFAKFYSFPLYSKKTFLKYKLRFLYIIYRLGKDYLKNKLLYRSTIKNQ